MHGDADASRDNLMNSNGNDKPEPASEAKRLSDWSREAQDEVVFGEAMTPPDRIMLGTLLRIAEGVERLLDLHAPTKVQIDTPVLTEEDLPEQRIRELPLAEPIVVTLVGRGKIDTVAELTQYTPEELVRIPGIGRISVKRIEEALAAVGARLR